VPPDECTPAELPDTVRTRLFNLNGEPLGELPSGSGSGKEPKTTEEWERIIGGVGEGKRNAAMTSFAGWLLRAVSDPGDKGTIDITWATLRAINERNRPPLDEKELRTIYLSILKAEQQRRMTSDVESVLRPHPETEVAKARNTEQMRLVIVRSDPPRYRLYAAQFVKAEAGYILLTAEEMTRGTSIRTQALKQAEYPLPKSFAKMWDAKGGLYERLILNATFEEAPTEDRRLAVVAERLSDILDRARVLEDDKVLPRGGRPCRLADGSIVFRFTAVWEELSMSSDRVTREELSTVLKRAGATWHARRVVKKLDPAAQKILADMVERRPPVL
jgi:hypothetical protein